MSGDAEEVQAEPPAEHVGAEHSAPILWFHSQAVHVPNFKSTTTTKYDQIVTFLNGYGLHTKAIVENEHQYDPEKDSEDSDIHIEVWASDREEIELIELVAYQNDLVADCDFVWDDYAQTIVEGIENIDRKEVEAFYVLTD